MAAVRAVLFVGALVCFFVVGTPLQWLVARYAPSGAHRIPLFFCRAMLRLARVRVDVEGRRARGAPVMLAANHVSWIDILALGAIEPFCFLAKSDVASWPVLSAFAKIQGTVFVDRRRRRSIVPANRDMASRLIEGRTVLLFPEGTTVGGPQPGRFHSSHFAAARDLLASSPAHREVLIQPVAIAYSSDAAAWIGDAALLPHLWRTLCAPPLSCRLAFGPPISFVAGSDRKAISAAARDAVAGLLARRSIAACGTDTSIRGPRSVARSTPGRG